MADPVSPTTRKRIPSSPPLASSGRGPCTGPRPHVRFELTGVRLDLGQAVQVARAHGALVE